MIEREEETMPNVSGEFEAEGASLLYKERTDWSGSSSSAHISGFVFNDVNRNGLFDLSDRPMAGIVVLVVENGVVIESKRTNANGWANFSASTSDKKATLRQPGKMSLVVVPPPGWDVTTGNAVQEFDLHLVAGSIGGLSLQKSIANIGLAPMLSISGQTNVSSRVELSDVEERNSRGRRQRVDAESNFRFDVSPGEFLVEASGGSRRVSVGSIPIDIGVLEQSVESAERSEIETIGFQNLTGQDICKIPSGYYGLVWDNFVAVRKTIYRGEGYVNCAVSGEYVAYNGSGIPAEISDSEPFDFVSCCVGVAWLDAEGEILRVEAFRGDDRVSTCLVKLSALGPVIYQPNISRVTSVRFSTAHSWQFVVGQIVISR